MAVGQSSLEGGLLASLVQTSQAGSVFLEDGKKGKGKGLRTFFEYNDSVGD